MIGRADEGRGVEGKRGRADEGTSGRAISWRETRMT